MKIEIKKAEEVFTQCEKEKDCGKIAPIRKKTKSPEMVNYDPLKTSEYIKLMDDNFGWCENPYQPYQIVKNWMLTGEFPEACKNKVNPQYILDLD